MNEKIVSLPVDADDYAHIAQKKIRQQLYQDAIPYLEKAIRLNSRQDYYIDLATCLVKAGKTEEGVHILFERIVKEEDFAVYFYQLSQIYTEIREPNKAFLYGLYYVQLTDDQDYFDTLKTTFEVTYTSQTAVEAESTLYVAQQLFQYLFSHGRIDESIDWLSSQPVHIQERKEMRNLKAMAYLFMSKYNEAEALLEQLLTEDETDIHALCHYTLLLYNTHQHEKFNHYLQRLNKLHPINEDESFKLGIVLSFLKQYSASQQLLLPIYKKKNLKNAQLLHALSFNYFALGQEKESEEMWRKLQSFSKASPSPKEVHETSQFIEKDIVPLLHSDDRHARIVGLFKLSQLPYKEAIISKELWDQLEQMGDYEKLYLSYIFSELQLVKLDFIHQGLVLLWQLNQSTELLLSWVDKAQALIELNELKEVSAYTAACYYLYMKRTAAISVQHCAELFHLTRYRLNKALNFYKQNNI
ncbi:tetratricopeptide repeat protein [Macrococcus brunensis]|uniref:tetratricopeptide repeat protein n=1 Tax=Macrococcus brunensis TaxID=198483 RepID=UPI001EF155F7|nr:hypothetical protein [Macrococcus brunensis]ULG72550.1 hypothetical protein MGG12_03245 [Macrococcus brunensis]ULG74804.1 hypothetical protein MGG13_03285 [Macrococcus brunensis]